MGNEEAFVPEQGSTEGKRSEEALKHRLEELAREESELSSTLGILSTVNEELGKGEEKFGPEEIERRIEGLPSADQLSTPD